MNTLACVVFVGLCINLILVTYGYEFLQTDTVYTTTSKPWTKRLSGGLVGIIFLLFCQFFIPVIL